MARSRTWIGYRGSSFCRWGGQHRWGGQEGASVLEGGLLNCAVGPSASIYGGGPFGEDPADDGEEQKPQDESGGVKSGGVKSGGVKSGGVKSAKTLAEVPPSGRLFMKGPDGFHTSHFFLTLASGTDSKSHPTKPHPTPSHPRPLHSDPNPSTHQSPHSDPNQDPTAYPEMAGRCFGHAVHGLELLHTLAQLESVDDVLVTACGRWPPPARGCADDAAAVTSLNEVGAAAERSRGCVASAVEEAIQGKASAGSEGLWPGGVRPGGEGDMCEGRGAERGGVFPRKRSSRDGISLEPLAARERKTRERTTREKKIRTVSRWDKVLGQVLSARDLYSGQVGCTGRFHVTYIYVT